MLIVRAMQPEIAARKKLLSVRKGDPLRGCKPCSVTHLNSMFLLNCMLDSIASASATIRCATSIGSSISWSFFISISNFCSTTMSSAKQCMSPHGQSSSRSLSEDGVDDLQGTNSTWGHAWTKRRSVCITICLGPSCMLMLCTQSSWFQESSEIIPVSKEGGMGGGVYGSWLDLQGA